MQSSTDSVVAEYAVRRPLYERLVGEICYALTERLKAKEAAFVSVTGRAKEVNSLREKIGRKHYAHPLRDITDLGGVRVVCNYDSDIDDVVAVIKSEFKIHEETDKAHDLGVATMGYKGRHFIVSLGKRYSGVRYDNIAALKCEIQARTILQDAWALISHNLVYKSEATIPRQLHRDLNNVASLLEIAQGVFDTVKDKRETYQREIAQREPNKVAFLSQAVDFETLHAYTKWKFPELPVSAQWNDRLGRDLDLKAYPTLAQVDAAVESAKAAVAAYRAENPEWFTTGTDFITKSLGFVDSAFRSKHAFGPRTLDAFQKHGKLVTPRE